MCMNVSWENLGGNEYFYINVLKTKMSSYLCKKMNAAFKKAEGILHSIYGDEEYVIVMNNYRPPDYISPELRLQETFRGVLEGGVNVVIFTAYTISPMAFVFYF